MIKLDDLKRNVEHVKCNSLILISISLENKDRQKNKVCKNDHKEHSIEISSHYLKVKIAFAIFNSLDKLS